MSATSRRSFGTGSLEIRKDKYGREIYYGRFYSAGRQFKRKLAPKRKPGDGTGLTKAGAERALQKLIEAELRVVPVNERVDLQTAGDRYLVHLEQVMQRKPSWPARWRAIRTPLKNEMWKVLLEFCRAARRTRGRVLFGIGRRRVERDAAGGSAGR